MLRLAQPNEYQGIRQVVVCHEERARFSHEEYVSVRQLNPDRDGLAVFSQPSQELLSNVQGRRCIGRAFLNTRQRQRCIAETPPRRAASCSQARPLAGQRSVGIALRNVRPTPGISCEAVPASMPLTGAGMRRHVHAGNHAAESFVSFIPLLGRTWFRPRPFAVQPDEAYQNSRDAYAPTEAR
jgi:hypothetical protein